MYRLADIRNVHLEITTRCNARCPQCPRTAPGGTTNPNLRTAELSLGDVQLILPPPIVAKLGSLYMCGNYGDAIVADDTLAVFEYLRSVNPKMRLRLHTNGSARPAEWWARLGSVIDSCTFSIDGLEDTNALYRRHTNWETIMRSASAFIGAGGVADWVFLVFRHNEHQIEQARQLAAEMGFESFVVKRSERFSSAGLLVDRIPVLGDRRGSGGLSPGDYSGDPDYYLELPTAPEHRNEGLLATDRLTRAGSYEGYLSQTPITCKAVVGKKIYVSAEGLVFPCCWLGKLYRNGHPNGEGELWELLRALPGEMSELDGRRRPLEAILDGPYFQRLVTDGWLPEGHGARPRLTTCAKMCGAVEVHTTQFARSSLPLR